MKSCIIFLKNLYRKRNLKIDIDGKIYKILTSPLYRLYSLKFCCLIMLTVFVYIFKKYKYYDVTIFGKTIYGSLISKVLSLEGINHVFCKTKNHFTYYDIEDEKINLEGYPYEFFKDETLPIIKNNKEDLNSLELHTGFQNLDLIQNKILSKLEKKGDIHYISLNNINIIKRNISSIKKFVGDLYIVNTNKENWITRLFITDKVEHLNPSEIVSSIISNFSKNKNNTKKIIKYFNDRCEILEDDEKIILTKENIYEYLDNNSFNILYINKDIYTSPFYNLKTPRPFLKKNNMFIIHPFHLPTNWDPSLNIMITTLACIKEKKSNV